MLADEIVGKLRMGSIIVESFFSHDIIRTQMAIIIKERYFRLCKLRN